MAKIGICPLCAKGTRPVMLILGYCQHHQQTGKVDVKTIQEVEAMVKAPKQPKRIAPRSAKKVEQDKIYAVESKKFLKDKECAIKKPGCKKKAKHVHHDRGRGRYYLDQSTWVPVCEPCHRDITDNSKQAIADGHSQRRNTPVERN